MLRPRNRPAYTRALTDDEPRFEQDDVELLPFDRHTAYDGPEKWDPRPASNHSRITGDQDYNDGRKHDSAASRDTGFQDNDVQYLLPSSGPLRRTGSVARRPRFQLALLPGWRRTPLLASCVSVVSLIINIAAVVWLSRHPSVSGLVELSYGQCDEIQRTDTLIHLAINTISTLLLSGSNYCMQCLSAPTRKEVDVAHHRGKYLDIGIPGVRNLNSIAGYKVALWFALALSSLPLHLLYNSAVYPSLSTYDYQILVVTSAFLDDGAAQSQYLGVNDDLSGYQRLSSYDCITQYAQVFLAGRSDLVIVSSNASDYSVLSNESYAFNSSVVIPGTSNYLVYQPFSWICFIVYDNWTVTSPVPYTIPTVKLTLDKYGGYRTCDYYVSDVQSMADEWAPFGYLVEYCLSKPMEEKCSLNGNIPIVILVIICNVVKAAIMLFVTFSSMEDPLLTVGDAIASFLQEPDPTTRGLCLLSRSQVHSTNSRSNGKGHRWPPKRGSTTFTSMTALDQSHTYFKAASKMRWAFTTALLVVCCAAVAAMLSLAINTSQIRGSGVTFWDLGFGTVHAQAIIIGWAIQTIVRPSQQILAAILVANTPQIILSFLYFSLNGLLTAIWLASEWGDFVKDRKFLRVSTPHGQQRSTYFLQLPYKVGIPLLAASALLHWLVSQSLFLAVVSEWDSNGVLVNPVAIATCGYSPMAMIFLLVLAAVIAVVTWLVARRKIKTTMPIVGSCSAAISAACHPPLWDVDAAEKPVMWGSMHQNVGADSVGHCSFSSGTVYPLQAGRKYM